MPSNNDLEADLIVRRLSMTDAERLRMKALKEEQRFDVVLSDSIRQESESEALNSIGKYKAD